MSSSSTEICPKSILRYRPIASTHAPAIRPWVRSTQRRKKRTTTTVQHARTQSRPQAVHWARTSSSFLVVCVGVGMAVTLLLILGGQMLMGWVHETVDTWEYGFPRSFQTTAYVGASQEQATGQPSHFLALNNGGQIEIIEFPGNDASHARIIFGPRLAGPNVDLVPVTLHFVDPQHTHRPNMLVQFQGSSVLFLNKQGAFQLQQQS